MVQTTCSKDGLFAIDVDFVGQDGSGSRFRHNLFSYGGSGVAPDADYLLAHMKSVVEQAMTDYLQANFDL
jgi:hypothetical protein